MPVIKEYECKDCGTRFETTEPDPACPTCTGEAERAFFTPPAIRHGSTTRTDRDLSALAATHGFSDMSNRDGAVRRAPTDGATAPQFAGPEMVNNLKIPANARDGFSPVMGSIQKMGGPRTWHRERERK